MKKQLYLEKNTTPKDETWTITLVRTSTFQRY